MAYVGTPIDTTNTFQSLTGDRFDGDASETAFTLSTAPSSVFDIEVFVGNVRQDPNSAYTVSGTTLTFTGAPPSGTNNIYVVHQAKAVGTIDVPTGGVVAGSLGSSVLTGQTDIGGAIADADLFLLDDGAGGTLRKTAASRIKTYIGDNTPAFFVQKSAAQTIANNTTTKVTFDTEILDTDNTFASDKFTPGVAGKYQIFAQVGISNMADAKYNQVLLYKNGSALNSKPMTIITGANTQDLYSRFTHIVDANATDYFEIYVRHDNGNNRDLAYDQQTNFGGMRIIGA
jgi:Fe-S cluster assembly iron-binding protein IscA